MKQLQKSFYNESFGIRSKFGDALEPILELNRKTKLISIFTWIFLLSVPLILFNHLESNVLDYEIEIHPDYLIPNHTLKNIGVILASIFFVFIAIFLSSTVMLFKTFELKLRFLQDIRIFLRFTNLPILIYYYGISLFIISIRRIPYYNENFDTLLILALILSISSLFIVIFNTIKWYRYIRKIKDQMNPINLIRN